MTALNLLLWIILGITFQVGLFLVVSFWRHWQSYDRLRQGESEDSALVLAPDPSHQEPAPWQGFRSFRVTRRVAEDPGQRVCSFYLEPEDRQALPPFKPGQFLTFRLEVPRADGHGVEQIVRCYSLSDTPKEDHYRISVKRVLAPAMTSYPPGRSSNVFHDQIQVGSSLQVRAPSGHFHLEPGSSPLVFIAGGIGITPLLSMLNWCQEHQPEREVWFFYGVPNSLEAAFASHLTAIAEANPNVHLRLCFSHPLPDDQLGVQFHHHGRVNVDLLRMSLPLKPFHYFICGPTPMMESLVTALEDWGVSGAHIHFEAFGPASITRRRPMAGSAETGATAPSKDITVTFAKSGRQARWSPQSASLLDFAESQGIVIDSGCRAGGCGTCQTTIRSGQVAYRQSPDFDPEPGTCLLCVCTPRTNLTLEA